MNFSYDEAKGRIPTQLDKIVHLLREAGESGATNKQLNQICLQYDARVSDLRRKGFVINVESLGKGLYKYFLIKTPSEETFFPNALEETFETIDKEWDSVVTTSELRFILKQKGFNIIRNHGWYRDRMKIN